MTLEELIERIRVVALETGPLEARPALLNTEVLIELLLPRCLDVLAEKICRTPAGLNALRKEVNVNFALGVGTLPASIREEHLETITFIDDLPCSYVPSWFEFNLDPTGSNRPLDFSRYTVKNGLIYYHQVNQLKN